MSLQHLKDTWDLDVFFKGGSDSSDFRDYAEEIKTLLSSFQEKADALDGGKPDIGKLKDAIGLLRKSM